MILTHKTGGEKVFLFTQKSYFAFFIRLLATKARVKLYLAGFLLPIGLQISPFLTKKQV
jgi:hypothetical protein